MWGDFVFHYTPTCRLNCSLLQNLPWGWSYDAGCQAEQLAMKPWTLSPYPVVRLANSLNTKPVTQFFSSEHQKYLVMGCSHGIFCTVSSLSGVGDKKLLYERKNPPSKQTLKLSSDDIFLNCLLLVCCRQCCITQRCFQGWCCCVTVFLKPTFSLMFRCRNNTISTKPLPQ